MANLSSKLSRYEGAMLGVAVGDALGAPLEFMSASEIKRTHGTVREMLGGGWLHTEPGEVTDDTQMTLAVAEGIVSQKDSEIAPLLMVGYYFLQWYRTNPKDIGNACRAAIGAMNGKENVYLSDWHETSQHVHEHTGGQTAGNGALMRTVYPALYYPEPEAHETAAKIARMTHWHDDSTLAVTAYTNAINDIVNAPEDAGTEWARAQIEYRMQNVRKKAEGQTVTPSGYVIYSAICAMNAIRDTNSFEDALVYAVNLGGDADTIGAITGGLAGAIYGAGNIPLRWLNALAVEANGGKPGDNALVRRLIDLAHIAHAQRTGKPNPALQSRNEPMKNFFRKFEKSA